LKVRISLILNIGSRSKEQVGPADEGGGKSQQRENLIRTFAEEAAG